MSTSSKFFQILVNLIEESQKSWHIHILFRYDSIRNGVKSERVLDFKLTKRKAAALSQLAPTNAAEFWKHIANSTSNWGSITKNSRPSTITVSKSGDTVRNIRQILKRGSREFRTLAACSKSSVDLLELNAKVENWFSVVPFIMKVNKPSYSYHKASLILLRQILINSDHSQVLRLPPLRDSRPGIPAQYPNKCRFDEVKPFTRLRNSRFDSTEPFTILLNSAQCFDSDEQPASGVHMKWLGALHHSSLHSVWMRNLSWNGIRHFEYTKSNLCPALPFTKATTPVKIGSLLAV